MCKGMSSWKENPRETQDTLEVLEGLGVSSRKWRSWLGNKCKEIYDHFWSVYSRGHTHTHTRTIHTQGQFPVYHKPEQTSAGTGRTCKYHMKRSGGRTESESFLCRDVTPPYPKYSPNGINTDDIIKVKEH